jgi:hypothetical protein
LELTFSYKITIIVEIPINKEKLGVKKSSMTSIILKEHEKYAYKVFAHFAGITCYINTFPYGKLVTWLMVTNISVI